MSIRRAISSDATQLSQLAKLVAPFFTIAKDGRGAEQFFDSITVSAMEERLLSSQFEYWLICDEHDAMVGTIALRDNSHVYHFFILPEFHGRGYARRLWEHAKAHAIDTGNLGIFTVNSSLFAEKMYAKFGFLASAEQQETHGLRFIPMQLNLPAQATAHEVGQ
ncbi:GNAT family N-acetyltransferase [Undibacterium fentianense]|nr:GNAT family N-acetyltransferase [Undibacterium fentianense]